MLTMILLCLSWNLTSVWAEPLTSEGLNQLERQVFGAVVGPTEPPEPRISRMEESVFGVTGTGSLEERLDRLKTALPAPTPSLSKPSNVASERSGSSSAASRPASSSPNLYNNQAPATSPQPPLYYDDPDTAATRQTQGFSRNGNPQEGFMMSPRNQNQVPYARSLESPASSNNSSSNQDPTVQYSEEYSLSPSNSEVDADMAAAVTNIEQKLFSQTYPADPMENRMARLEVKLFNEPAPQGASLQQRFDRLVTVAATDQNLNEPDALRSNSFWSNALPVLMMLLPLLL